MRAQAFWKVVVADQTDFLSRVIELLNERAIELLPVRLLFMPGGTRLDG